MTCRRFTGSGNYSGSRIVWLLTLLSVLTAAFASHTALADEADDETGVYSRLKAGQRVEAGRSYAESEQPVVYLTFDDGPSRLTPRVLDILQEEGVKATFFVLGNQVEQRPEVAARIASEGHALGNHTYNHVYSELYSRFDTFWEQARRTDQIIAEAAGTSSGLLRAPGGTVGNFDPFYFYYLEQAGYTVVDWNIDSGDATRQGVKASEIVQTVKKGPLRRELTVLLHDGAGHDETVKALPEIIHFFKDQGYTFASLTDQVRPVQFSTHATKWKRSESPADFERRLATVRADVVPHPETAVLAAAPALPEPPAQLPPPSGPQQLKLRLEGRELALSAGQFIWSRDHFLVPLRTLVEGMGGQVAWREAERTAIVRWGDRQVEYDCARLSARVYEDGPGLSSKRLLETSALPELRLVDGVLYVPLRGALEQLNGRVADYTLPEAGTAESAVVQARYYGLPVWERGGSGA